MLKKDKKKFFKAGMIFCIWLIAVFYIGSNISQRSVENNKQTNITEYKNETGEGLPDEEKTPEQKDKSDKLNNINALSTKNDFDKIAKSLQLPDNEWEIGEEISQKNIPIVRPYFPKGQNINAWREALVLRSFVNVKMKNPIPTATSIYQEWLKGQLPDIQINFKEEGNGNAFSGYSNSGKVFISGKIFNGSLDTSIYIIQYVIKNDGKADVEQKAKNWSYILSKIQ